MRCLHEWEKDRALYNWLKPQLQENIQVFMRFANFYQQFIKSFSRIATMLSPMLQITSGSIANISIFANGINEVNGAKVIKENSNKKSKI